MGIISDLKKMGGYVVDEESEVSAHEKDEISVDADAADVNIYTHAHDSVKARLHGKVMAAKESAVPCLELKECDGAVVVRVKYPENFSFRFYCSVQLDVTIPENWTNKLQISTVSGDIYADKLTGSDIFVKSTSGDITIRDVTGKNITSGTVSGETEINKADGENGFFESVSGSIRTDDASFLYNFEAITVSGDLKINRLECATAKAGTTSGDIEMACVSAGNVKAETGSGDIKIRIGKGSLELITSSGNIKAEVDEGFNSIKARSVSGDIKLHLPAASEFSLKAESVSGDIKCNFPVRVVSADDNCLTGVTGSGRGEIAASSVSGDVLIT
ncbi:hypothetical protein Cst_c10290 [Thermoclostridium stercorarium subsp. stercorarium DSM 8532]|jgi:DUF4097 and DUF4098 domain-containing protein YvlB|uniref:DUF4097 domain-containing protein n=3 Tax=Thermoclostridium stercorarium TaxID=1510 RepID=L7VMQ4_THES1|nr:DUF4097 family beta strand repeat-containing protein [Thermoclostridium stercorarium]AGC68027.1 hypothetical protein Cst_c10290 [Thermoclostridium stercorarium subsp. stercorarium DSM 8532]AGI39058.1 hypothetical protein Clst_0984 [Thermoclostridium stercorarium subsp. stercorarium DSM 8532]ANW98423.1 hypothetical protein CSTERTH_04875 [Thermoclostridium stercorarium subsp. thermolacticum DSM 2910]ANX00959.1 hypothetical protein CSTERLE_04830 [Thermoclostridium stercorarium subsp. leptospart